MWEYQLAELSEHARVIAPDLRGFGESEMPAGTTEISTYADDVRELLDQLGVHAPAVVGGFSMGGYVAMAFLRRYPGHVAGLILANTKATADSIEGKAGRDKNIALAKEKGAAAIADAMLPKLLSPRTLASNDALVARVKEMMMTATVPGLEGALASMRDRPDSTGTLLEFGQPVLVVAGAEDQLMTPADAESMKQAARNSTLVTIAESGHLSPMEQPKAFNEAALGFIREFALR
jgi:pimeloyl-ACP methyl ester carboxylesterase